MERTYALAPGQYQTILKQQGGRCAICRKIPRKRNLAVDHDHNTGQVRGLLCFMCNSALGVFEFNTVSARNASDYLRRIADSLVTKAPDVVSKEPDDLPF